MSSAAEYPHLLSPLALEHTVLRNRAIMGSMHTRLDGEVNSARRQAAFYAERARGEIGLMVTGGFAPNTSGLLEPDGPVLDEPVKAQELQFITDAVHEHGGKICLQILHAGRYAKQKDCVAPSAIRAPINTIMPRALSSAEIEQTIEDYAYAAVLAKQAGFDGVEIMGSEGYLINQFTAPRTNDRVDKWGGIAEKRHRFPVEVVRRSREAVGTDFIIMYRISALDLVEGGATGKEIDDLAAKVEAAGADILNTGIGWHEARVPTIAYMIPRGAWRFAAARLKKVVSIPVVASNRINMPDVAEEILASSGADLVSMARPLLADPQFMRKAREGSPERINTCIACNQACLDYIFSNRVATCLVNPKACYETEFSDEPADEPKRIAVLGAGAGGLAFASEAAARGHQVVLYEASDRLGGQLNLARAVPGKEEFGELLRYFDVRLREGGVEIKLNCEPNADEIVAGEYDEVVVATGIAPRTPDIDGVDHPKVVSYVDILNGKVTAGKTVAIIGSGGIGFDVAEYLVQQSAVNGKTTRFFAEWSVDTSISLPGGLMGDPLAPVTPARDIYMLQRKSSKPGAGLGVSTGWILRNALRKRSVKMLPGVTYEHIDDEGLHITCNGERQTIRADTIVICAGQEPNRTLYDALRSRGLNAYLIGGAELAMELDARRAIDQGVRLAQRL